MAGMIKKLLIALLLVSVLYGLYLQFANKNKTDIKISGQTAPPVTAFPDTDCRADRVACTVNLSDRQLRFLLPKTVLYLQPFPVEVFLTGFDKKKVASVSVQFEMQEMDMGFNKIQLSAGKEGWQGSAILPFCVSGRSDWNAIVDVKVEEEIYRASFALQVSTFSY